MVAVVITFVFLAALLAVTGSGLAAPLAGIFRSLAGFHWPVIRTVIFCLSGVGVCSSTTTVEKKPELMSLERKSPTCCESRIEARRARSPRRFMEMVSMREPGGAAFAMMNSESRYGGWLVLRYWRKPRSRSTFGSVAR